VRVAVVSDIHANLRALEAVLEAIDRDEPDELWCLGDLVGYGPRPNECCALVRARAATCLAGNHDLAVRGTINLWEFSGDAGAAAAWTRTVLDDASQEYLDALEPKGEAHGVALFHGSPRDPVWEYVISEETAAVSFALTEEPLLLVGHSHAALEVSLRDTLLAGGLAPGGTELELAGARRLLNPGSVGQPRDGDPRAAYGILDHSSREIRLRRVIYPVESAQRKILAAGLPASLANRLALGR